MPAHRVQNWHIYNIKNDLGFLALVGENKGQISFSWKINNLNSTHEISTSSSVNFMAFWLRFGFILSSREVKNVSTSLPPKYESMKPNLSQKAMKLGPNDN